MTALTLADRNHGLMRQNSAIVIQNDQAAPSIRGLVLLGLSILVFFFGGSLYWAMTSKLDGAVVAPASLVVEGNRKTVEHLEGGIVSAILVSDGDYVEEGQVLIELDSSAIDVDLNVLGSQLADLMVRRSRLIAQITNAPDFVEAQATASLPDLAKETNWQLTYMTQKQLFETERRARQAEADILDQRVISLNAQIEGITEQRGSNARQLEIAADELVNLQALLKKGLIAAPRVSTRQIDVERLRGTDLQLKGQQSQASNEISELRLSGLSNRKLRDENFAVEIATIEAQLAVVSSQFEGATKRQSRIKVVAPASGRVVEMNVFTAGGVVRPGEPILDIVPDGEGLIVEAKVNTADIEKLHIGQATRVRLSAFDQGNVPEAEGKIFDISADSLEDARTGEEYYIARVRLDIDQPIAVSELELLPGMPADLFVNTGERTAISYLTKPLADRISRTFIE